MRVLIAEDDLAISATLKKRLEYNDYEVTTTENGIEALNELAVNEYDILISDIMMPQMDGLELLQNIRKKKIDIPVLFLTAKDNPNDIVKGLDLGADDYMVKPFEFAELMARIRLLTRRHYGTRENSFSVGDLTVDTLRRTAKRGDKLINLSKKEFDLLLVLVKNKNIVVTKEKIADSLYGWNDETESNTIAVYINFLRKKIDDGFDKKLIETIRGVGYTIKDQ